MKPLLAFACVSFVGGAACGGNPPVRPPVPVAFQSPLSPVASDVPDGPSWQDAGAEAASSPMTDASSTDAAAPRAPHTGASFDVAATKRAATASNRMGFDVYPRLPDADKNAVFSPPSMAIALAMAASGARGETLAEMRRVLHSDAWPDTDSAFAALSAFMNAADGRERLVFHAENRLWGQRGVVFNDDFVSQMTADYGAPAEDVDFRNDPIAACKAIDAWASGATHGRVPHLFDRCPMGPLVLTTAVYFKGKWQVPFEVKETSDLEFHTLRGEKIRVPTMRQNTSAYYAHVDGVKVLELPYRGGLSMLVAVPDDPKHLAEIERHLGARSDSWRAALASDPWDVDVYLPKWTANPKYSLGKPLSALGMRLAFGNHADFSGIQTALPLAIDDVGQFTFIAVDEEGTEAAAVTGLSIVETSLSVRRAEFRADRPFIYLIEDRTSGAVLFVGRVVDPR